MPTLKPQILYATDEIIRSQTWRCTCGFKRAVRRDDLHRPANHCPICSRLLTKEGVPLVTPMDHSVGKLANELLPTVQIWHKAFFPTAHETGQLPELLTVAVNKEGRLLAWYASYGNGRIFIAKTKEMSKAIATPLTGGAFQPVETFIRSHKQVTRHTFAVHTDGKLNRFRLETR